MTRGRIALAIAASLAPACHAAPLRIELPKHDGAKALIVAIEHGALDVVAIDPARPLPLLPSDSLAPGDSVTVVMLAYPQDTLDDMGIDPGPLVQAPADDRSTLALDAYPFAGKFAAVGRDGPVGSGEDGDGWSTLPSLDAALAAFKPHTRRFAGCLRFDAATYPLGISNIMQVGAPIDDTHSLIASNYGQGVSAHEEAHYFAVTATGATRTSIELTGFFPFVGGSTGDGEVWFAGGSSLGGAQIWHGRPGRGAFQLVPRPPDLVYSYWIRGLQVSRTGTRTVATYSADSGTLGTYEDGHWHTIASLGVPFATWPAFDGNNLATHGDEAWFVLSFPFGSPTRRIAHVKGGQVLDPIDTDRPVDSIAYVPALDKLVVGGDDGEILALEGNQFVPLASAPPRTFSVFAITPTKDGFLFSGERDTAIGQYVAGFGYCPPTDVSVLGQRSVLKLIPLGTHAWIAIGQPFIARDSEVAVLTGR
jgi:hypothetical protein